MIRANLDSETYIAAVQTFALAQYDITERLIGKPETDSLGRRISNNSSIQEDIDRMSPTVYYQDPKDIPGMRSVIVGGILLKTLVGEGRVNMHQLTSSARAVLRDPDFFLDLMDISREHGITDRNGISTVSASNRLFVIRMLGSLHRMPLEHMAPLGRGF